MSDIENTPSYLRDDESMDINDHNAGVTLNEWCDAQDRIAELEAEAAARDRIIARLRSSLECKGCNGTGYADGCGDRPGACEQCSGSGRVDGV